MVGEISCGCDARGVRSYDSRRTADDPDLVEIDGLVVSQFEDQADTAVETCQSSVLMDFHEELGRAFIDLQRDRNDDRELRRCRGKRSGDDRSLNSSSVRRRRNSRDSRIGGANCDIRGHPRRERDRWR